MRLASNAMGGPAPVSPSLARRLAVAVAVGGGGMGVASALLTGVFVGEFLLAHRTIPAAGTPPPDSDGAYGTGYALKPLRMVILGDSLAAGFGVDSPAQTLGALLAEGVVEQVHRPVTLGCFAAVGAVSRDLTAQVARAVAESPDIAIIVIGSNDVTHRVPAPSAVRYLVHAVAALRAAGAEVIVGTCPDLGTIRPIQPPLRWLVRRWSRQMAEAQTMAVVRAGGRTVSLGDLLGPLFDAEPDRMFAVDRFHPSADGYAAAAAAVLPSVLAAIVAVPQLPAELRAEGEAVCSLRRAAAEATHRPGTEVSQAPEVAEGRAPAGRWAQLRRRVRRHTEHPTGPATGPASGGATDAVIGSPTDAVIGSANSPPADSLAIVE